jgi:diamine N-acetyltransferase
MKPVPEYLENDIIKLRALEVSDLELLYNWENDTTLWSTGATITPFSKHVLMKYLETAHLDIYETKQLRLMIDLKTENYRTIGAIDLFDFDPFNHRAGIGILIAGPTDRGKGFASEALNVLIAYCFELLGLHQLYCNISPDNTVSLKLFQNHGFKKVGLKKEWTKRSNKYFDEFLLQLINPN